MNFNFIFQVQPYLKYYVGRKHMFDNNYKEAEEYLSNAFEHCQQQILTLYLIPVKMLLAEEERTMNNPSLQN